MSDPRRRALAIAGVLAAVALLAAALALAGVFASDDEQATEPAALTPRPPAATTGAAKPAARNAPSPRLDSIAIGGRPTGIAVGEGAVWVADPFSAETVSVTSGQDGKLELTRFSLQEGSAAAVAAGEGGVFYALQEQEAVERRDPADPAAAADQIALDGFASAIAVGSGSVWALTASSVARIDPASGEVVDELPAGGFATAIAVDGGRAWVIADNREVLSLDAESGEAEGEPIEVTDAVNVAAGRGSAWVVSATGAVTRIDADSLAVAAKPTRVRGALDIAVGEGAVWVTSVKGTVTRLDPASGEIIGKPLRVGDEPTGIAIGEGSVWVANAGDATLTRIDP